MPSAPAGLDLRRLLKRGERVFPACPQVSRYFPASSIEDARRRLSRGIDRGDGPGFIVGGAGTGKSLLLQVLAAQYQERFDVVLLAVTRVCTRRALLQSILFELGLPYQLQGEGELRLGLLDHLLSTKSCPSGLLLLVDEAQTLSPALLDELRMLTNLVLGNAPRVRLVLAGSAALEESFAMPELASFSQRLSSRCYLAPLTRNETCQYVRSQLAAAQADPDAIIDQSALSAVFDATDGVPRLVNQLCDRALVIAEIQNRTCIDGELIQAAWSDLQQLPTPWEDSAASTVAPSQVVEFGYLGGENDRDESSDEGDVIGPRISSQNCDEPTASDYTSDTPFRVPQSETPPPRPRIAGDPFAEQFDEEEVVLDSFGASDESFWRGMPRVENRRDPGFAGLVQAALDASPAQQPDTIREMHQVVEIECDRHPDEDQLVANASGAEVLRISDPDSMSDDDADAAATTLERPSLRLADLSEPMPLVPISLVEPLSLERSTAAAFDPVFPDGDEATATKWQSNLERLASSTAPAADYPAHDADQPALLVIEDDPPATKRHHAQVRREEYRHLFSRLRSG